MKYVNRKFVVSLTEEMFELVNSRANMKLISKAEVIRQCIAESLGIMSPPAHQGVRQRVDIIRGVETDVWDDD